MEKEDYQFQSVIKSEEELRSLLGYPSEVVKNKVITYLDRNCKEFISKSPFLVLSTTDTTGCDVSPRGDQAGFVKVLSENRLLVPERPGNKRMDSLRNILSNPSVGLLFLIPGLGETLRVNGKATIVRDEDLLEMMSVNGKKPLLGIVVEVEECFIHCAKAFLRSNLWEPSSWLETSMLPSPSHMLFEHISLPNTSPSSIKEGLEESYTKRLY
ncbi:pyridoxamine 5'-phosphate oxidase family protein [Evansella sp. AB-rgal1]|uniref:pyridoxamine 5'-phosphate oxidase family protein n=1 Tax=Evansella sp. AB-rgal1 TaxID=3242696 RepID=UPI00359D4487